MMKIKYFNDKKDYSNYIKIYIEKIISNELKEKDKFYFVLPGGNTLEFILDIISDLNLDWAKIYFLLTDERCVLKKSIYRNDLIISKYLKKNNFFDFNNNFIGIPAELGPEDGAREYREILESIPNFDLCILGLGEDGHTASLFSDDKVINDDRSAVPVFDSPKLPKERVSLGLNRLRLSKNKIVLVYDKEKLKILELIESGRSYPITLVSPNFYYVLKNV